MQIRISTRHGQMSEETRAKITGKVEKLARYFDRITAIDVTVDLEQRDKPEVDVRITAARADDFVAKERSNELMAAVDRTCHKLEQQLRKFKERVQQRHRQPHPPVEAEAFPLPRPEEA